MILISVLAQQRLNNLTHLFMLTTSKIVLVCSRLIAMKAVARALKVPHIGYSSHKLKNVGLVCDAMVNHRTE